MGDVVFGRFNSQQLSVSGGAEQSPARAQEPQFGVERITQHPLKALEHDLASSLRHLGELAGLLSDPQTDPHIAQEMFPELVSLQDAGNKLAEKLSSAKSDDSIFLAVQTEMAAWGQSVRAFEQKVLDKTDSEIVETRGETVRPSGLTIPAPQPRKFPIVWVGIGLVALGSLTWVAVQKWSKPTKKKKEEQPAFKKVKLKRALPAR